MKLRHLFATACLACAGAVLAQQVVMPLPTNRPAGVCFLSASTGAVTVCDLVPAAEEGAIVKVWDRERFDYVSYERTAEGWSGDACARELPPGTAFWLSGVEPGAFTGTFPLAESVETLMPTGTHLVVYPYPVPIHWTNLGLVRADLQGSGVIFFTPTAHVFRSHMRTRSGWQPEAAPDEVIQPGEAFWYVAPATQRWIEARPQP